MPNDSKIDISEKVISRIKNGQVKMKPRWRFVLGSFAMLAGLIGLAILSVFIISLISFSLRSHGPMGAIHFEQLVSTFPWGASLLAIVGIGFSVWLFKKYDFSYKTNFLLFIGGFVLTILFVGWLINYTGLDEAWRHRGPMKEFYQRYDGGMIKGHGWRMARESSHLGMNVHRVFRYGGR